MTSIDWLHSADDVDGGRQNLEDRARYTPVLSTRQREVLLFLISGNSQKQIARKMNLSQHTVNDHIKEVYKHFHVTSRSEFQARFTLGESGSTA
jgi:DNA-binding CsgD family transcriptional regulator